MDRHEEYRACAETGEDLDFSRTVSCPHCGRPIPHNASFCYFCGEPVRISSRPKWVVWTALALLAVFLAMIIF
ncbi:MAG: zinc-ribbon domain-containing protein [Candidatus Omnitrophica bacterium]|nr:zinc-ribbon domain-containing protein [Candidatus Omnitrophota bacterium]